MHSIDIYFDYVSPFAYLLNEQLNRLPESVQINHCPVLFAGLLKHWGQLGPVEVERKRQFTYRHTVWLANKLDVAFKVPWSHPFNPLPYLRLTIALDNDPEVIAKIYRVIWSEDIDPSGPECWNAVCETLGVTDADRLIADDRIKSALRSNTESAISLGVFGVPTITADGELFWGLDSLDMLIDYLDDDTLFESAAMKRIDAVGDAISRPVRRPGTA